MKKAYNNNPTVGLIVLVMMCMALYLWAVIFLAR